MFFLNMVCLTVALTSSSTSGIRYTILPPAWESRISNKSLINLGFEIKLGLVWDIQYIWDMSGDEFQLYRIYSYDRIIIIVRAQLIQLLRGLVTKNFEPENSRS
jgi:hypothetical protein